MRASAVAFLLYLAQQTYAAEPWGYTHLPWRLLRGDVIVGLGRCVSQGCLCSNCVSGFPNLVEHPRRTLLSAVRHADGTF